MGKKRVPTGGGSRMTIYRRKLRAAEIRRKLAETSESIHELGSQSNCSIPHDADQIEIHTASIEVTESEIVCSDSLNSDFQNHILSNVEVVEGSESPSLRFNIVTDTAENRLDIACNNFTNSIGQSESSPQNGNLQAKIIEQVVQDERGTSDEEREFQHSVDEEPSLSYGLNSETETEPSVVTYFNCVPNKSGLELYNSVLERKEDSGVKLLKFMADNKLDRQTSDALLKLIKNFSVEDLQLLPRTLTTLERRLSVLKTKCTIGWICENCQQLILKTYDNGNTTDKANVTCCDHDHDYNDDHFVLLDATEVLALTLPKVWYERRLEYAPEHLVKKMDALNFSFDSDFSVTLNADGVPACNKSNKSLWPILGYIDCCPAKVTKSNIIVFGMWVGKRADKCAQVKALLRLVVDQLRVIGDSGFQWRNENFGIKTSRCIVSRVLADSMARPSLQGLTQFNSFQGCGYCYHLSSERHHYYEHLEPLPEERTHDLHCLDLENGDYSRGLTGRSVLLNLPYFDIIQDFPPDILHCVHLGVARQVTMTWLKQKGPYYITKASLDLINSRLMMIRPPRRASRVPSPLKRTKGEWKGHEWGMWAMYYSGPILQDILPEEHFNHWMSFVRGISLLTRSCITLAMITEAEVLLNEFSMKMLALYGQNSTTFNVHLLRHLPNVCRKWGPLQNFSMTPFENFNMRLKSYLHSTQALGLQVYRNYFRDLISSHVNYFKSGETELESAIGAFLDWNVDDFVLATNCRNAHLLGSARSFYAICCLSSGRKVYSKCYKKMKKRNSYTVILKNGIIAEVEAFFGQQSTGRVFAVVNQLRVRPACGTDYIYVLESELETSIIAASEIKDVVVVVPIEGGNFYGEFLNNVENVRE